MPIIEEKDHLRADFRIKRRSLPALRRSQATQEALAFLMTAFSAVPYVLSYASFDDEFDTMELNGQLAAQGKLLLPRISGADLKIFLINDIEKQLRKNSLGIQEPVPELCVEGRVKMISVALVPALAYDSSGHRLGYGKGFYDRFLKELSLHAKAYGLGFKEQLMAAPMPTLSTDIALHGLFLF